MGKIVKGLLGGGTGKQKAYTNQGLDFLKENPLQQATLSQGLGAQNNISALLGLGGDQAAANNAFGQYRNSTGYDFRLGQGMDAITGNAAARGLLNSGATLKALTGYGQDLASAEFGNYLGQLGGVANAGQQALSNQAGVAQTTGNNLAGIQGAYQDKKGSFLSGLAGGVAKGIFGGLF